MASLSAFRTDTRAVHDGEWIDVGSGENAFRIKTRGFTPKYRDRLNALKRDAARLANRSIRPGDQPFTVDNLPPTADDMCQGIALSEEAFLDVSGLSHADGSVVTAEEFHQMLRNPEEFSALLMLAIGAAARVHSDRQIETGAAVGNSPAASAPS